HGNEFCGMVAVAGLLDSAVRPKIGILTLSFANVGAYESFTQDDPFASRQLVHNLNRIWSPQWLDGDEDSPELRRARELRPVVAAADHILDIHSTAQEVDPFWVYPAFERNTRVAMALGGPDIHLVMPGGMSTGTPLIQHGLHGEADSAGVALVAECGQHFNQASADLAVDVTRRFLSHFGLIDSDGEGSAVAPQRRFELLSTAVVKADSANFARPLKGLESFGKGELIGFDGEAEVRSPCDACTVFMPSRKPVVGREFVYLTRPI
ncbi:MAG: succinylglutamate desuccinylase/aspartoacylase family protein, partial [Ramlibacter sp.]|nr:succinylglutamate desuccinylase/aspartoacylase family protein [Ramlibacter sp.]